MIWRKCVHGDKLLSTLPFACQVDVPTKKVIVNAADLEIESVQINGQSATVELFSKTETAKFTVAEQLEVGAANIEVSYVGVHNDKLEGFYRTKTKVIT